MSRRRETRGGPRRGHGRRGGGYLPRRRHVAAARRRRRPGNGGGARAGGGARSSSPRDAVACPHPGRAPSWLPGGLGSPQPSPRQHAQVPRWRLGSRRLPGPCGRCLESSPALAVGLGAGRVRRAALPAPARDAAYGPLGCPVGCGWERSLREEGAGCIMAPPDPLGSLRRIPPGAATPASAQRTVHAEPPRVAVVRRARGRKAVARFQTAPWGLGAQPPRRERVRAPPGLCRPRDGGHVCGPVPAAAASRPMWRDCVGQ